MNWGKLLQEALLGEPDKVPRGWKTSSQIADELGKSACYTRELLLRGVAAKKIESKRFRIFTGTSRIYPVLHYRAARTVKV